MMADSAACPAVTGPNRLIRDPLESACASHHGSYLNNWLGNERWSLSILGRRVGTHESVDDTDHQNETSDKYGVTS